MSEDHLIEKIKGELMKSGFPLELKCRRALYKQHWALALNRFYMDAENVEREIDARAYKQTASLARKDSDNMIQSVLIVECKKNEANHWVFFDEGFGIKMLNVISTLNAKQNRQLTLIPQSLQHHYLKTDSTSSFCMAFKSPINKNQIFEGLQELFNAYKHERDIVGKYMGDYRKGIWINIYYPVIVFDGKLFTAKLVDENLKVEEVRHILYTAQHPSYIDPWITVDIVRADFFSNYLETLDRDHEIIVTYIDSKLVKEIAEPSLRVTSPTVEEIRKLHPRAYEKWKPDEQKLLTEEFQKGVAIEELAKLLQRQPSAIRSRLTRLGFINEEHAT